MSTRKIKDAKDLSTNELIYFKGHAKATYMSDGTTVEDAINNIEVGGGVDLSDYATKEELSSKQNTITDLEVIRQGAAKGATALQSYTEQYKGTVTGVKVNGTTKNPSNGVVDIGNVITAHQTLKTINGQSIIGSGDITISGGGGGGGDYLPLTGGTIAGDLTLTSGTGGPGNFNAYGVYANEVSGQIFLFYPSNYFLEGSKSYLSYCDHNGSSLLVLKWKGDGTKFLSDDGTYKTISGGSSSSGAYAEVNHGTSDTTFTLTPNTFHVWDEVASLTLDFGSEIAGVVNEYLFQFTSGATATTLTLPDNLKWANDVIPSIKENRTYQISILKGLASVLEFAN
jgi:hypothetical protein